MKITKQQLKQIIKEEIAAVMEYDQYDTPPRKDPCDRALTKAEASVAKSLGYIDPYDDGFRNAAGAKQYLKKIGCPEPKKEPVPDNPYRE